MCDVIPEDTRLAWTEPILLPFLLFINKVPMLLFHCKVANRNNNSIKTSVSITVRISAGSNLSPEPLENVHQRNTSSHPPTFSLALKESHIPWISSPQFLQEGDRDTRQLLWIIRSRNSQLSPEAMHFRVLRLGISCLYTTYQWLTVHSCFLSRLGAVHPAPPWTHKLWTQSTCVVQHIVSVKTFSPL